MSLRDSYNRQGNEGLQEGHRNVREREKSQS